MIIKSVPNEDDFRYRVFVGLPRSDDSLHTWVKEQGYDFDRHVETKAYYIHGKSDSYLIIDHCFELSFLDFYRLHCNDANLIIEAKLKWG